jgi:catechol 2,3-dioxygenase-like lactoylglutathione lyase family enzyme
MTTSNSITEVATVLVPVADQDRALAFYTERLGFRKTLDYAFGDNRWIEVSPGRGTTTLALAPGGPDREPGVDTGIRLSTDDARADHAALREAGVDVEELLDWGGGVPPMFVLRDPDGNRLVVVQQPPRS